MLRKAKHIPTVYFVYSHAIGITVVGFISCALFSKFDWNWGNNWQKYVSMQKIFQFEKKKQN